METNYVLTQKPSNLKKLLGFLSFIFIFEFVGIL